MSSSIFENKHNLQLNNDDFAVLYRTNAQSRSIEDALRRKNIPYQVYGGLSFYHSNSTSILRKSLSQLYEMFIITCNVFITTHDFEFAKSVGDRVIELTPKGAIDRLATFDSYMTDPKVQEIG